MTVKGGLRGKKTMATLQCGKWIVDVHVQERRQECRYRCAEGQPLQPQLCTIAQEIRSGATVVTTKVERGLTATVSMTQRTGKDDTTEAWLRC